VVRECKVSLVSDEEGQILEFPPDLALPSIELLIRKEHDKLIVEPANPDDLPAWLMALEDFDWSANIHKGDG
jgi:virulence-associated protein VagC